MSRDPEEHWWDPLAVEQLAELLQPIGIRWWIAGGHAIELFVGRTLRAHGDIDAGVLRADQEALRGALDDRDPHIGVDGRLEPWESGRWLDAPLQDIWCRDRAGGAWRFQLMLVDTEGEEWGCKRDRSIRRPVEAIGSVAPSGVPYLRPEIQMLYHARPEIESKHKLDFDAAWEEMDGAARGWLLGALRQQLTAGHPWLRKNSHRGE